ncbi:MAG: hypothetical protein IKY45_05350, partial [Clostridia bacterium]|nr:hypothetical protein [Clostridia bacterium]
TVSNVFQYKEYVYVFCSDYVANNTNEEPPFHIYKISFKAENGETTATSKRVGFEDIYIPTIATNVGPVTPADDNDKDYNETWSAMLSKDAVLYEGYNLIGKYYKVLYSTLQRYEPATDFEVEDKQIFRLPYSVDKLTGKITLNVSWSAGSITKYVVELNGVKDENGAYWGGRADGQGGWQVRVKGDEISFWESDKSKIATRQRRRYLQNDMEVIAPAPNTEENYRKVLNMTCNEWFGGDSEGIYGGMHLFMCGNTQEKEKSLVLWSDINKPLYFSENCYAYVGESTQKATAFGRQGKSLIIFKERELYATNYSSTNVDENATIVDITATDVVFPMIQVHGYIGCDCPYTVQLCRNRLVWLNSDGKVYALVSANQYNERSVYELSQNIRKDLQAFSTEELQNALSADWNGHYVLTFGNKILLMDYNTYGFSSVYSYSKEESAQKKIPWWIWNIPERAKIKSITSFGGECFTVCETEYKGDYREFTAYFDNSAKCDSIMVDETRTDFPIASMFQTKLFDFGIPTKKKNVPSIEVLLGSNDGIPMTVTTITEQTTNEEQIVLSAENSEIGEAGYFQKAVIKPLNRINYRVALKIEAEGKLEVSDLVLKFKKLGG